MPALDVEEGARLARAFIYGDQAEFVLPEGLSQEQVDRLRQATLDHAQRTENEPWIFDPQLLDRCDEILRAVT